MDKYKFIEKIYNCKKREKLVHKKNKLTKYYKNAIILNNIRSIPNPKGERYKSNKNCLHRNKELKSYGGVLIRILS